MKKYRIVFQAYVDGKLLVADSYEMEPYEHDSHDSWAIASDLGSYATSIIDPAVWFNF